MVIPAQPLTKPFYWGQQGPGLVTPEWQWAWNGLVAAFVINEGLGPIHDVGRYRIAGSLEDGTAWATRRTGRALSFDGTNDYVSLAGSAPLGNHLASGTLLAVMELKSTDLGAWLGSFNDADDLGWHATVNGDASENQSSGRLNFFVRDTGGNTLSGAADPDLNTPSLEIPKVVIITWSGADDEIQFWVNGEQHTTTYDSQGTPSSFTDLEFPLNLGARNVRGTQDRFADIDLGLTAFWSRQLTTAEIAALFRDPFGPFRMADVSAALIEEALAEAPGANTRRYSLTTLGAG